MTLFLIILSVVEFAAIVALAVFCIVLGLRSTEKTLDKELLKLELSDEVIKKEASKECDRLLRQEIGKTIAGVNDGKRYNWKIHYDNDGEDKCSVTRFGVDNKLSDIVNLINRRAIEWGCDITCIEVKRVDVDSV